MKLPVYNLQYYRLISYSLPLFDFGCTCIFLKYVQVFIFGYVNPQVILLYEISANISGMFFWRTFEVGLYFLENDIAKMFLRHVMFFGNLRNFLLFNCCFKTLESSKVLV